jgi:competence protein ComEC
MPMAVAAFIAMPLHLEYWPLKLMDWGNAQVLAVAHGVAALPHAVWTPAAWPQSALLCFVAAGLFFMLWKGRGRWAALIPLAVSFAVITLYQPPDILAAADGKLVAYRRVEDGLLVFSNRRADKFAAEVWARGNGQGADNTPKWEPGGDFRCDEAGCRLEMKGRRVAFETQPAAAAEDCGWADIIVSNTPIRDRTTCAAKTVVDLFDLYDNGVYAITLDQDKTETVRSVRGRRPWTVSNRR